MSTPTLDRPTLEALQRACKKWLEMEGKAEAAPWSYDPEDGGQFFGALSGHSLEMSYHPLIGDRVASTDGPTLCLARNLFRPAIQAIAALVAQILECLDCHTRNRFWSAMNPRPWEACATHFQAAQVLAAFLSDPQVAKMVGEAQASEEMESKR